MLSSPKTDTTRRKTKPAQAADKQKFVDAGCNVKEDLHRVQPHSGSIPSQDCMRIDGEI